METLRLIVKEIYRFEGLLTATISSEVFKCAQPALLFLVPFTLIPLLLIAHLKVILEVNGK